VSEKPGPIIPHGLTSKEKGQIMIANLRDASALRQLRIQYEESAGLDFPEACLTEMLILYNVCKSLGLTMFQAQEVLGAPAWKMVTDYINGPVGVPTKVGIQLVSTF
jgi:hypothetical protein